MTTASPRASATASLEGHRRGIVTSTSVLVLGPAFASGVARLADHPGLDVGVHLALAGEDPPVSSAREIPTLVDRRGRLPAGWHQLLPRLAAGRVTSADVRTELSAQLAVARQAGVSPTHLDCHQHAHLWPSVGEVVLDLARDEGIRVVRSPRARGHGTAWVFDRLGRRLAEEIDGRGLVRTGDCTGWEHAGRQDEATLVAAIGDLAAGGAASAELMVHPGRSDAAARDRYRWGYRWDDERRAVCAEPVRRAVEDGGFTLVGPSAL